MGRANQRIILRAVLCAAHPTSLSLLRQVCMHNANTLYLDYLFDCCLLLVVCLVRLLGCYVVVYFFIYVKPRCTHLCIHENMQSKSIYICIYIYIYIYMYIHPSNACIYTINAIYIYPSNACIHTINAIYIHKYKYIYIYMGCMQRCE